MPAPVMWYTARAVFEAGYDVLGVEYGYYANRVELDLDDLDYLIEETAGAVNSVVKGHYSNVVLVGKSLGTIVQSEIRKELAFPAPNQVFLTPLKKSIPAMVKCEHALVIVGDQDNAFGESDRSELSPFSHVELSVIPGADHRLETEDYRFSVDVLKQVAVLCENFCRKID